MKSGSSAGALRDVAEFFRFPHTPHLAWLGEGMPRDDKILEPANAAVLLDGPVVVEEKIDGANLGFSATPDGELRIQNRGSYLDPHGCHPQFRLLWDWLAPRREGLLDALWPNLMLFGEWCAAVHSVPYDGLPDWFLAFDVYDQEAGCFWATERRDQLVEASGLSSVPLLACAQVTKEDLVKMLGRSRVGAETMEGLVVRREVDGWTSDRAKLVRAEFVQAIDTHWSRGPIRRNHLRAQ